MTQMTSHANQASEPAPDRALVAKCAKLSKTFRDFWLRNRVKAVDAIDLEVYRGEIFGLLGPNGSGKSTTIKILLGLLHPSSGHVAVFGHSPRDVRIKQQIGYLPEESYLYPFLNARETLDYYGRLFHLPRSTRLRRIETLLEYVGLDRVATRPVGEYSKGMQRRIGLAQALINDPQFLILDEPTTGLDPIGTRQIKDLILQLKQRGKTILLCSHLLADVEDVCDRVAIMYGGKVRREGTVDTLLTEQDRTTIDVEQLGDEDLAAIERLLTERGKRLEAVHHPRQKLEALFMQIVEEAQSRGWATSGAGAGGVMAEFLRGDEAQQDDEPSGQAIVQKLMDAGAPERRAGEAGAADDAAVPAEPQGDADVGSEQEVLSELLGEEAQEDEPAPKGQSGWASLDPKAQAMAERPAPAEPEQPDEPEDADQIDRSVLDSLVSGAGQDDEADEATPEKRRGEDEDRK